MAIDPTGDPATLLKDVGVTNTTAINAISDLIGTAADSTVCPSRVSRYQVTSTEVSGPSCSDVLAAVQKGFQLLSARNQAAPNSRPATA